MTALWTTRYPQERGPIESAAAQPPVAPHLSSPGPQNSADGPNDTAPAAVGLGKTDSGDKAAPAADTHDYRDFGLHELKRDPGREWERNQQREYAPGLGRR